MKRHMEKARGDLADLAGLAGKTEAAERRILKSAETRLAAVQGELDRARAGIEAAPDSAQVRYLNLVSERAQLQGVISKARQALGE